MNETIATLLIVGVPILAFALWVRRLRKVTINTDGKEPFFGSNALPWIVSLVGAIGVMWLLQHFMVPAIAPYTRAFAEFTAKTLGL